MEDLALYEFKENFQEGQSERTVCIGERVPIEKVLNAHDLGELFGGSIIYRDGRGAEYLGVWGTRKAQRFRRLLREREATIRLHHDRPLGIRVSVMSTMRQFAR